MVRAGLGRLVPKSFIRVGVASTLPGVLFDLGIQPNEVFGKVGISASVFSDPDNTIPFSLFAELIALSTRVTGRDDLGLLICERTSASSLGVVGFYLQQAPDVRTALGDLVRYLHHHDRGAVPFLATDNDTVRLGYLIYEPDAAGCDQIYDGALAIGRNIMRALCGPQWAPSEVLLSRPTPPARGRYERFFNAPVRFEAEQSAILFDEKWLDIKLPTADAALRKMLQEQVELLDIEDTGNWSEQVRRLLRVALLTHPATMGEISTMLRLKRRTLARRLELEEATFSGLADEVQFEIARQLLRNTSLSVTEVGLALHFSELSAFSRAFTKWSGSTPMKWRADHRAKR
ncbi:AraC-like DNA-binding protein [Rhodoligotrophos appendicifer]|uniref:AraC family transcriptional regulator n=1 Tax=Rhodoligotrophos appendicifer TaxID=987056 RepID=UPI001185650F|nr:AraC family transcriptional regulator [Rhodoligotrophos appendicifer]